MIFWREEPFFDPFFGVCRFSYGLIGLSALSQHGFNSLRRASPFDALTNRDEIPENHTILAVLEVLRRFKSVKSPNRSRIVGDVVFPKKLSRLAAA